MSRLRPAALRRARTSSQLSLEARRRPDGPRLRRERVPCPDATGATLGGRLDAAWNLLEAGESAICPICTEPLRPAEPGGCCEACGTTVS